MDIAIVSYQRFTDMPREVYNECCQMGHTDSCQWSRGQLRPLTRKQISPYSGKIMYRLRSALIMYSGDTIVGWAALYDDTVIGTPSVGVWIKTKHRRKGYGIALIKETYRRWNKHNPTVYRMVRNVWDYLQLK